MMDITMAPLANYCQIRNGRQKLDPNNAMDRKRLKRRVSNRISAQRSRDKKTQHIQHLEKLFADLQVYIANVTPKVQEYKDKTNLMRIENHFLLEKVQRLSYHSKLQEMELEKLKEQVAKLKELENGLKHHHMYVKSLVGLQNTYPKLSFYQEDMKSFIHPGVQQRFESSTNSQHLKVLSLSCTRSSNKVDRSSSRIEQPLEISGIDKMQEENDIDQYLDIDAGNVDFLDI